MLAKRKTSYRWAGNPFLNWSSVVFKAAPVISPSSDACILDVCGKKPVVTFSNSRFPLACVGCGKYFCVSLIATSDLSVGVVCACNHSIIQHIIKLSRPRVYNIIGSLNVTETLTNITVYRHQGYPDSCSLCHYSSFL